MKKLFLIILISCMACDAIIEVVDISNETITVLAPTNGSTVDSIQVVFTWEPIENAENYRLQVATPTFENASQIVIDTLISKTNFIKALENANYEWRIRAENSDYQTNYTNTSFRVGE